MIRPLKLVTVRINYNLVTVGMNRYRLLSIERLGQHALRQSQELETSTKRSIPTFVQIEGCNARLAWQAVTIFQLCILCRYCVAAVALVVGGNEHKAVVGIGTCRRTTGEGCLADG